MQHRLATVVAASAVFTLSLVRTQTAHADHLISDWNLIAIDEIKAQGGTAAGPNAATRALAIVHLAIYDTVAAFDKSHRPYLVELDAPEEASVEAAVAGAAYYTLVVLLPARRTALNQRLNDALDAAPGAQDTIDNGYDFGVEVADRILASRAGDGSATVQIDAGSSKLGKWRPISANAADAALEPAWRYVRPFAISKPSAFRPSKPPKLGTSAYIAAVEEVRALGGSAATAVTTVTRTSEQTLIADFWKQPTHIPFSAIARQVVNARDLTLEESARFFAQLSIALADSRIAAWDAKYEFDFWRPYHAIRSDDGNAQRSTGTTLDAAWTPYLPTPAHPEYPSGHSTTSAAAAAVLSTWFGEDVGFTVASDSLTGVTRSFASFRGASEENGRSRIYGGIHYQFANAAGQTLGAKVGHYVTDVLFSSVDVADPRIDPDDDAGVPPFDAGTSTAGSGGASAGAGGSAGSAGSVADPKDAGVADASRPVPGRPDASSAERDGGPPPYVADAGDVDDSDSDDGCSCSVPGARVSAAGGLRSLALIGLALLVMSRRRRG